MSLHPSSPPPGHVPTGTGPTDTGPTDTSQAGTSSTHERASTHISKPELTAWRRFLRAHAHASRKLEADLLAAHDLPLTCYDVLVQLVEASERRLRMTELADRVLLSRSGLTRMVDRMVREGLVSREACTSDARGLFAVLTDKGYARLREATGTHLRGVKAYVTGHWDEETLQRVDAAMTLVLEGSGAPDGDQATQGTEGALRAPTFG